MDASFILIMFFVFVGIISLFKALSGNKGSAPIDLDAKPFKSSNTIPVLIGSFLAYQFIGNDNKRIDFYCTVEYDESDKTVIVLIDGRKISTKMKLNLHQRNSLMEIIDKAIEWGEKAAGAGLIANKLISSITTVVSFVFNNQVYYSHNSEILFKFYNNTADETGSKIFLVTNKYDVGGVLMPAAVIWIENYEFDNIKSLISEERIMSVLKEQEEKIKIVDSVLN